MLFRVVLRPILLIGLLKPRRDLLDRGLETDEGAHLGLKSSGVPLGPSRARFAPVRLVVVPRRLGDEVPQLCHWILVCHDLEVRSRLVIAPIQGVAKKRAKSRNFICRSTCSVEKGRPMVAKPTWRQLQIGVEVTER